MSDSSFQTIEHPSFRRNWYAYIAIYWVPFVAMLVWGHVFGMKNDHYSLWPFAKLMFFLGFAWFIGALFFPQKKCPKCGYKTKRSEQLENGNMAFKCNKCHIVWDLGVKPSAD